MRIVHYEKRGGPEVLKVLEVPNPKIKDDEVLIQVTAVGVNLLDLLRREVDYYTSFFNVPYLGHECSGLVIDTGSNVLNFTKGDKVCAFLVEGGGYAELAAVPAMFVKHIPAGVSLVEAAALPSTICFTYYCLAVLRQATRGKKVLIHAASRGFGLIALQYAKYCGCDVFAAAETQEKLETCGKLGADVCINYSKEDFSKRVKDETAGKGVDIILDVKGPYYFAKNVNCLARRGTLITLGFESGNAGDLDCSISKSISEKKLRHLGANIFTLPPREVGTIFSQVEELVWPLFKDGTIKPTVSRVFCFSQAAEAHKAMESDIVAGNVVLVP